MKKRYVFLSFVISILIIGFNNNSQEIIHYKISDFQNATVDKSDSISLPYNKDWLYFNVLKDSLVVIWDNGNAGYFVEIRNINTGNTLLKTAKKGSGINQFNKIILRSNGHLSSTSFYILEEGTRTVSGVYIDSLLAAGENYTFNKVVIPSNASVEGLSMVDPGKFLTINQFFMDDPMYNNKVDRFVKFSENEIVSEKSMHLKVADYKYFVPNVNKTFTILNKKKDVLFNIFKAKDKIDIFKASDLKLQKSLIGPYFYKIEYGMTDDTVLPIVFDKGYHKSFVAAAYTDSVIYLLFNHIEFDNYGDYQKTLENGGIKSEVFKYDWNGMPLKRYILNAYASTLDIDSKEQYFFCTVRKKYNEPPYLAKFKIR
jgi:hypothetical protein